MINNVVLMGRLTRDPELRFTQAGTAVVSFTIAVERNRKSESGERSADFIDCSAWRQTGEFINKWFGKGKLIAVTGELRQQSYTNKEGKKVSYLEVVVSQAAFTGERSDASGGAQKAEAQFQEIGEDDGEDLPF
jgi:single-strand DNA-binding protein